MVGGELGGQLTEVHHVDVLILGALGQLGRARGQADMEAMGQGEGAVAGVLELGDLVLVHPDVDAGGLERLDRLEAAMGPSRRHGVGAVGQGADLVDHETRHHHTAGTDRSGPGP